MNCLKCGIDLGIVHHLRKYCSIKCRSEQNEGNQKSYKHNCKFCGVEFLGKEFYKFCSQSCNGKSRVDHLHRIQQAQRKYPKIDGLNRMQIYRKFNPEKGQHELHRDNIKRVVLIQALGGCCVKCGYTDDIRALQLDHINGDGYKDRKEKGKAGKVYRYYVNKLDEAKLILQVLCANCHAIKSIENRDHDSKRAKEIRREQNASNQRSESSD